MVVALPPRSAAHRRRIWAVDIKTTDRFEWEVYDAMREWLTDNMPSRFRHAVVYRLKGGKAIKYVGFEHRDDAMLFYLRFA